MLIDYYLIIIGRRRGAAAGGAERGGAAISRRPGLWSLELGNGRAALDSRGCLPPVAAQAGGGGEATCSADREQAPPCPVCDAGRWSCHGRVASEGSVACLAGLARGACQPRLRGACGMSERTREGRLPTSLRRSGARYPHPPRRIRRRRATRSRRLDCPRRVRVANQGGTHSGTVPAGRGSRGGSRGGTAGTRGAGLVFGKTRIALLANFWLTRAPGRAFGGRAAVARLPKSYATACDLDSAHAPLLATTHPMNCRHP